MAATRGQTLVIYHQAEVSELERRKWLWSAMSSQANLLEPEGPLFCRPDWGARLSISSRVPFIFSVTHGPQALSAKQT